MSAEGEMVLTPLPAFGSCEVLRKRCQHAWMARGRTENPGRRGGCRRWSLCPADSGQGKRRRCPTSSLIFARADIDLSGNEELGLRVRVIHAWLVGRKMSAAANLREDTRLFLRAMLKGKRIRAAGQRWHSCLQLFMHPGLEGSVPVPIEPIWERRWSPSQRIYTDIRTLPVYRVYLPGYFLVHGPQLNSHSRTGCVSSPSGAAPKR